MTAQSMAPQDTTQRKLLTALLYEPGGLSVARFADRLGITASAVRQQLAIFEAQGLVRRRGQQSTGGRPEYLYELTAEGREAFPRRYLELAVSLLSSVAGKVGPETLHEIMRDAGSDAGRDVVQRGGGPADVAGTVAALKAAGYEASVDPEHPEQVIARNCVFHKLAERYAVVCEFDLGFMRTITGRRVDHLECMVRGGRVCRFAFGPENNVSNNGG